jgi:hypothetical protein
LTEEALVDKTARAFLLADRNAGLDLRVLDEEQPQSDAQLIPDQNSA